MVLYMFYKMKHGMKTLKLAGLKLLQVKWIPYADLHLADIFQISIHLSHRFKEIPL